MKFTIFPPFCKLPQGIFISFVGTNTPAAMGGLRFGDQVLQINGSNVAGWSKSKAMDAIKKSDPKRIEFAVRDRQVEIKKTIQLKNYVDSLIHF